MGMEKMGTVKTDMGMEKTVTVRGTAMIRVSEKDLIKALVRADSIKAGWTRDMEKDLTKGMEKDLTKGMEKTTDLIKDSAKERDLRRGSGKESSVVKAVTGFRVT